MRNGCRLFPSCLECNQPKCLYEEGGRVAASEKRRDEMKRLRGQGLTLEQVAGAYGLSVRTVSRVLKEN